MVEEKIRRCAWAGSDPLYIAYHDREWGVPVHDDRRLFEMLILEGMQAGLSWITVLRKREEFRRAFDGFEPGRVAGYGETEIQKLLENPGIIRNRLKIEAAVQNARSFQEVRKELGSFDRFIWSLAGGKRRQNHFHDSKQIPSTTPVSEAMSKELKKRGFRFVGATVCYAFMQAVGMVNDHLADCFRHAQIQKMPESSMMVL
jgi:DNA-3-methyladenine glycosylase I